MRYAESADTCPGQDNGIVHERVEEANETCHQWWLLWNTRSGAITTAQWNEEFEIGIIGLEIVGTREEVSANGGPVIQPGNFPHSELLIDQSFMKTRAPSLRSPRTV
jgi:hypothetical protein